MPAAPDSRTAPAAPSLRALCLVASAVLGALVWAYWTTFVEMAQRWEQSPQYSHGYLVPLFALWLLWVRRGMLETDKLRTSWWGAAVLLAGVAMRLAGAHFHLGWFDPLSLIPCLAGIVLLLGGWHAFRWSGPAVGFLFFMMPLPYTLEVAMQDPLRRIGTVAGTYLMQTLGLPAIAEGHVITVNEARIGVVEACSGLRMMMVFFALSAAVALVSERPGWQRAVIALSAVPIALFANVTRITVTAILYATGQARLADVVFHDLAGWLMMPLGLGLLWLELWFLSRLFIVEEERPMTVGLEIGSDGSAAPASAPAREKATVAH